MDENERNESLAMLERTRDEFLSAIAGITDAQARWKPMPERWSVLECAEHVAFAETGMLRLITERAMPRVGSIGPGREREILEHGADRRTKLAAPERSRPSGRFGSLAEAIGKFQEGRARSVEFTAGASQDLHALEVQHPLAGLITAQECLALLTVHPARHAAQIRELREDPAFPR